MTRNIFFPHDLLIEDSCSIFVPKTNSKRHIYDDLFNAISDMPSNDATTWLEAGGEELKLALWYIINDISGLSAFLNKTDRHDILDSEILISLVQSKWLDAEVALNLYETYCLNGLKYIYHEDTVSRIENHRLKSQNLECSQNNTRCAL